MKKTLALAAVVAGVAVAGTTFASAAPVMMTGITNPWYVGIGANYTANMTDKFKGVSDTSSTGVTAGDTVQAKLNNRGWGGNIFVGYVVNKYFGTELGFSYLGTDKFKVTNETTGASLGTAEIKNQWNVHFVGNAYLPVTDWFSPYAFAGVGYINYKAETGNNLDSHNYSGFGLVYGAGLQFNIDQFGIRGSYTVQNVNNDSNDDKDYISLDVLYRFGA